MMLGRYFHTLRYLKSRQFLGRLRQHLPHARPVLEPVPSRRPMSGCWVAPCARRPSLLGPRQACFLNEVRNIESIAEWDDPTAEKLWRYNLHYFDDLNAESAPSRRIWHEDMIERWIAENPPGRGTGWEPYPTSVRIVNWVKSALAGGILTARAQQSLAVQARFLCPRFETHLLANHYFANAKALVFAGMFFDGPEANSWLKRGQEVIRCELLEQVLADGGHFERSAMYHALFLEDMLDLLNLSVAFGYEVPATWFDVITRMFGWLATMTHPDGDIAFFNDAAIGVSPNLEMLVDYAKRLGLSVPIVSPKPLVYLEATGFARLSRGPAVLLADVGSLGPDYQPGHAHAESLSFELSMNGARVLVNTGTSVYAPGVERLRQRGTRAHNTLLIDGEDSSEVWSAFRVARRARATEVSVAARDTLQLRACHDGYRRLRGSPIHCRIWKLDSGMLEIADRVEGGGYHQLELRFHFHPAAKVQAGSDGEFLLEHGVSRYRFRVHGAQTCALERASYHPEFGQSHVNCVISAQCSGNLPLELYSTLRW